jgi:hypothetical protein
LIPSPSTVRQFIGGAVQSYYEQGCNNQDYQCQPPAKIRERRSFSYLSFTPFSLIFSLLPVYA